MADSSLVAARPSGRAFYGKHICALVWAHGSASVPNGPARIAEGVDFGPSGGVLIVLFEGEAAFALFADCREDGMRNVLTHIFLGTQTDDKTLLQLADGTGLPFELLASVLGGTYVPLVDVEEEALA